MERPGKEHPVAVVIAYDSNSRRAIPQLDDHPQLPPAQAAFWFPDEADKGDTVLYFVGGRLQSYVATWCAKSGWNIGTSGAWAGYEYVVMGPTKRLAPFVAASLVAKMCASPPKDAGVVPALLAPQVIAFLRGSPRIRWSARWREPPPRLTRGIGVRRCGPLRSRRRRAYVPRAVDFRAVANGLGERCLVVHHKKQLKDYDEPKWTSASDLAVVCANCHMMIHANPAKALSVAQLRKKL